MTFGSMRFLIQAIWYFQYWKIFCCGNFWKLIHTIQYHVKTIYHLPLLILVLNLGLIYFIYQSYTGDNFQDHKPWMKKPTQMQIILEKLVINRLCQTTHSMRYVPGFYQDGAILVIVGPGTSWCQQSWLKMGTMAAIQGKSCGSTASKNEKVCCCLETYQHPVT